MRGSASTPVPDRDAMTPSGRETKMAKVLKVLNFPGDRWGGKSNEFDLLRRRKSRFFRDSTYLPTM